MDGGVQILLICTAIRTFIVLLSTRPLTEDEAYQIVLYVLLKKPAVSVLQISAAGRLHVFWGREIEGIALR